MTLSYGYDYWKRVEDFSQCVVWHLYPKYCLILFISSKRLICANSLLHSRYFTDQNTSKIFKFVTMQWFETLQEEKASHFFQRAWWLVSWHFCIFSLQEERTVLDRNLLQLRGPERRIVWKVRFNLGNSSRQNEQCRNSVQGKLLITDEQGETTRQDLVSKDWSRPPPHFLKYTRKCTNDYVFLKHWSSE